MAEVTFNSRSLDIGPGFLDRNGWTVVGTNIVQQVIHRIKDKRYNVYDAKAKPYSSKGPIYIALTGKGRTKRSLGGRQVITRHDLGRSRDVQFAAEGVASFLNSLGGPTLGTARAPRQRGGAFVTQYGQVTPSGKSVKFRDYAEYKKFLGKSGERDLEVSGAMLNNLDIVSLSDNGVIVGFKDDKQAAKMAGNIAIDDQYGLSPSDKKVLLDLIETEGLKRIRERWSAA